MLLSMVTAIEKNSRFSRKKGNVGEKTWKTKYGRQRSGEKWLVVHGRMKGPHVE